ncbi:MAG TPA: hypothetical protein VFS33_07020 [Gemmatimonadales bacterium]|nr:hypothetical protein [Gemmatimonadales bacterium]
MMLHPMHAWLFWLPLMLLLFFAFRARSRRALWWATRWDRRRDGRWHYGRPPAPSSPQLDEGVRARLELVEQLESRVTELENRLDFAERLLAGRHATDPAAQPGA